MSSAGEAHKRKKTLRSSLQRITGKYKYFQTQRSIDDFHKLVNAHLKSLHEDGQPNATLCPDFETCGLCHYDMSSQCQMCQSPFQRSAASLNSSSSSTKGGGAGGFCVFPLFIPKYAEETSTLHLELALVCSERCGDALLEHPFARADAARRATGNLVVATEPSGFHLFVQWLLMGLAAGTLLWSLSLYPEQARGAAALLSQASTWNMLFQLLYFTGAAAAGAAALLCCPTATMLRVRRALSLVFALAFVVAFCSAVIYWGTFFVDHETLHPTTYQLPELLNHLQHTIPIVLLLLEMLMLFHPKPEPLSELLLSLLLPAGYCLAVIYLHMNAALPWPYRFFEEALPTVGAQQRLQIGPIATVTLYALTLGAAANWLLRKLRAWRWPGTERL